MYSFNSKLYQETLLIKNSPLSFNECEIIINSGSDSDFEFLPSSKPLSTNDMILNIGESPLLGAPVERQTLKEEIKNCYLESKRKNALKKWARMNKKSQTKRRNKMKRQFPEHGKREFLQNQSYLTIVIKHVNKGTITRLFPTNSKMNNVYDWVGSLSIHPVHFKLGQ